jgi:hypothetical protein
MTCDVWCVLLWRVASPLSWSCIILLHSLRNTKPKDQNRGFWNQRSKKTMNVVNEGQNEHAAQRWDMLWIQHWHIKRARKRITCESAESTIQAQSSPPVNSYRLSRRWNYSFIELGNQGMIHWCYLRETYERDFCLANKPPMVLGNFVKKHQMYIVFRRQSMKSTVGWPGHCWAMERRLKEEWKLSMPARIKLYKYGEFWSMRKIGALLKQKYWYRLRCETDHRGASS